ncbi:unnamed protein product [Cyprideis torosa]|uniref:Guanine nucleotide-binding protein G(s) subunit alpha n=1 Tax=Cyprideis torosa TaxID=163714 RepID=A0A7R8W4P1_9CRUS|nr:unnamed protein product [Cyprideis torosa]CAG0884264.1 unnamed protein product [Cyprideis torosa]
MGQCCAKSPSTEDEHHNSSDELPKEIQEFNKGGKNKLKILLLGAGESGKTTIMKQMKILHIQGFSKKERMEYVPVIRSNIFQAMSSIVKNMGSLDPPVELENSENREAFNTFLSLEDPSTGSELNEEIFDDIKLLWQDPGIQKAYARSNEYYLIDSAEFFLNRIDEIREENFVPDDQFILRSRRQTTGLQKIDFSLAVPKSSGGGHLNFSMCDVGGQRQERMKWIYGMEDIQIVLFLVSCAGFNMMLQEDSSTNRLEEALDLFRDMFENEFLMNAGFILFLNKQDLLKEKLENGAKMEEYFPEFVTYELAPEDIDKNEENREYLRARAFIKDKFMALTQPEMPVNETKPSTAVATKQRKFGMQESRNRENRQMSLFTVNYKRKKPDVYTHYTVATDTENINKVFLDVQSMIIKWNLEKMGMTV